VETAIRLERVKTPCLKRQQQLLLLQGVVEHGPEELDRLGRILETVTADAALYAENREVIPMEERISFGEELLEAVLDNGMQTCERLFDTYRGFSVYLPAGMDLKHPYLYVRSRNGGTYRVEMETEKPLGCAMRLDRLLEGFSQRAKDVEEQMETVRKRRAEALLDLEAGNPYLAQVAELEEELAAIDRRLEETEEKTA